MDIVRNIRIWSWDYSGNDVNIVQQKIHQLRQLQAQTNATTTTVTRDMNDDTENIHDTRKHTKKKYKKDKPNKQKKVAVGEEGFHDDSSNNGNGDDDGIASATKMFSLLCYNIGDWVEEKTLNAIKESEADVICLQETDYSWEKKIRSTSLDNDYLYSLFYHHRRYRPGGITILSKYPLRDCKLLDNEEQVNGSWFPMWEGVVELGEEVVVDQEELAKQVEVGLDEVAKEEAEEEEEEEEAEEVVAVLEKAEEKEQVAVVAQRKEAHKAAVHKAAVRKAVVRKVVKEVRLLVLHLRPPLYAIGYDNFDWQSASKTNQYRLAEAHYLASYLLRNPKLHSTTSTDLPIIICGDFNENDTGGSLSFLTDCGSTKPLQLPPNFTTVINNNNSNSNEKQEQQSHNEPANIIHLNFLDAVRQFVPSNVETHRWPVNVPLLGKLAVRNRLDHVLYTHKQLKCNGCFVIPGYEAGASDHMPILSFFSL